MSKFRLYFAAIALVFIAAALVISITISYHVGWDAGHDACQQEQAK